MKQPDRNRLNMWKAVSQVLQDNNDTWKDNPAFSEAADDLKRFIDAANGISDGQATGGTTGITSDKEALADDAIDKTLRVANIARAYARKTNNHTLLDAVDYSKSSLQKTPLAELASRLSGMLKAAGGANDELVSNWGLPKGADTAATAAIEAFSKAAAGTRVAISGRTALTATLPQIMRGGKAELLVLDDLVGIYRDDAPAFVGTYKAARNIVDAGMRHEGDKPQELPGS